MICLVAPARRRLAGKFSRVIFNARLPNPPRNGRTIMTDTNETADHRPWHEIVLATLKANDVRLIVYVPDRVLTKLIAALHADDFFTVFAATREEEAVGIVSGAYMAGLRGAVLMQTSGFATLPNAIASLGKSVV